MYLLCSAAALTGNHFSTLALKEFHCHKTDKPGFLLFYFMLNLKCRPNKSHTDVLGRMVVN